MNALFVALDSGRYDSVVLVVLCLCVLAFCRNPRRA